MKWNWLLAAAMVACSTEEEVLEFTVEELEMLAFFRQEGPPAADPTNSFSKDADAAALGQFLFFDPRLSGTGDVSCASCHDPAQGFGDGMPLSETLGRTDRHAMTLLNSAYQDFFYWDGRSDSLWAQALSPIENPAEMGGAREKVAELMQSDASLHLVYESVFGTLPRTELSEWEVDEVFANVGKAIAAYEQVLVRQDAPFDRFLQRLLDGERNPGEWMGVEAQRGLKDFLGDAGCHFCHFGPQFSNKDFHNIGLPLPAWDQPLDAGRYDGIPMLLDDPYNGAGEFSDDPDWGALQIEHLVQSGEQLGQFKTPSLRNLLSTAPYMHAGHFEDLDGVLVHYAGLKNRTELGHREETLLPFEDSTGHRLSDLKALLESLEGEPLEEGLSEAPASPFAED